ncbi:transport and Golgi organization protein 1 [Babesia caballi]|uniref:Transport and Golgi organization protein 1 n=1 Tax=Babesia caballi TaxID=5871 RepID=A0AAV4LQW6_BABCB|nr:transport and Golgi organization protein 1 [Babesia caballi]
MGDESEEWSEEMHRVVENDNMVSSNVTADSVVDGAHTMEKAGVTSFVDIFGENPGSESCCTWSSGPVGGSGSEDVDQGRSMMPASEQDPNKLTFSDRVLYETKKLRKRLQRANSEVAGHVTPSGEAPWASVASQPAMETDDFSPYTAWAAARGFSPSYGGVNAFDARQQGGSGGCSARAMDPSDQIMEWFRNKQNFIDVAYAERAVLLASLKSPMKAVEDVAENVKTVASAVEEELARVRQENDRLRHLVEGDAQLKQRLEESAATVDELENTLAIERKHNEENLKDKMVLQQRIANYSEELKNLNESMDMLKSVHRSEVEEHEKRKAELLAKVAQLQKDITHINDNLFSCYKVVEAQKTELAFLKKQNEELKDELKRCRGDLRRLYEANSSLKSQNLSLIEINSRIRTKTLFKMDTADTCSTRESCSSKASCISRDEFSFLHSYNNTPSAMCNYSDLGHSVGGDGRTNRSHEHNMDTVRSADTLISIGNMTKRAISADTGAMASYDHHSSIFDAGGDMCREEEGRGEKREAVDRVESGFVEPEGGDLGAAVAYGSADAYLRGDVSNSGTYRVYHPSLYSADHSTQNYEDTLDGRSLTTEDLYEAPASVRSKSWLLEKVSRVSNRDSLDYLREKIKLITSQDCKGLGMV